MGIHKEGDGQWGLCPSPSWILELVVSELVSFQWFFHLLPFIIFSVFLGSLPNSPKNVQKFRACPMLTSHQKWFFNGYKCAGLVFKGDLNNGHVLYLVHIHRQSPIFSSVTKKLF